MTRRAGYMFAGRATVCLQQFYFFRLCQLLNFSTFTFPDFFGLILIVGTIKDAPYVSAVC